MRPDDGAVSWAAAHEVGMRPARRRRRWWFEHAEHHAAEFRAWSDARGVQLEATQAMPTPINPASLGVIPE